MEEALREISGGVGAIVLIVFVLTARFRPRRAAPGRARRDMEAELLASTQEQNRILRELLNERRRAGGQGAGGDDGELPLLIPHWRPTPDQEARMILGLPIEGPISRSQVKKAYKTAVRAAHPDQGGSAEAFRKVRNAYEFFGI
ncbi:J domain-containing protein [Paracoccus sp. ME4]|uniref:J domain-containing protein n=1 Tax=Paracoccus sp. ME4 TaxID=3138066 RepID=UPI00398A999C